MTSNSFGARRPLRVGDRSVDIFRLDAVDAGELPYSLKVLLENLLRHEDDRTVSADDVRALAAWAPEDIGTREIAFAPARVLMQDFTGVPAIVDLAAMREAVGALGGDPQAVNPLAPVELVIDHSVVVEEAGHPQAFERNADIEFGRNRERYAFLRWGQEAFDRFRVVPPNTGICHQVNLEHLSRVVVGEGGVAYPDTLVGTDSHTPMVNGLGVLGWGVGGIEAEAAMLGQPISMLIPEVVGFKLSGALPEGATATDLVLTIAEMLRRHGVVGKFVEFYGPGVAAVPLANRATIGNMSPEYGSTCAIFPVDDETLRYLRFTGRSEELVSLVEAYTKEQGLFHDPSVEPRYSARLELDLGTVVPSIAGPARPQDRVSLGDARGTFRRAMAVYLPDRAGPTRAERPAGVPRDELPVGVQDGTAEEASAESFPASDPPAAMAGVTDVGQPDTGPHIGDSHHDVVDLRDTGVEVALDGGAPFTLDHGSVVIAAITSCTNTSNPEVMIAAGLVARNAVRRGLAPSPWVKTSLAPGSKVVMDYYARAGLDADLDAIGFNLVGYGCTTCIGNSGPLHPAISRAIDDGGLSVSSVLSGNRNFEGRIHPEVRMNWLASPPLVVAYALAGTVDIDLTSEPLGRDRDGNEVFLRDVWPSSAEVAEVMESALRSEQFTASYGEVFRGDERWRSLPVPDRGSFEWEPTSTYVRRPPYFDGMTVEPPPLEPIVGARALAVLGDSVTTDHISPAGVIRRDSPAGRWLLEHGVPFEEFNSYGARRGNHEVMIRGTFANVRLRNRLVAGVEGGVTRHLPDGEQLSIYDAAMRYEAEGVPLVILAGKEYGSGSSRDWAAKGTRLLGVRAVIAESYERIHRSNLVGMGVAPLELIDGATVESLGLTGEEEFAVEGLERLADGWPVPTTVTVRADGREIPVRLRIDTPSELDYFRHGGILPFVVRRLRGAGARA